MRPAPRDDKEENPSLTSSEVLLHAQRAMFERLIRNKGLDTVLRPLLRSVERLIEGAMASVNFVSSDGKQLRAGVWASVPESFERMLDGVVIEQGSASCSSAVFLQKLVVTPDIETDPSWEKYREGAKALGIRAGWSHVIALEKGKVVGAFSLYFRRVRHPTEQELKLFEDATYAIALAVEHVRTSESLAQTIALQKATLESTADGILAVFNDGKIESYNRKFAEMWRIPESLIKKGTEDDLLAYVLSQLKDPEEFERRVRSLYEEPNTVVSDRIEFKDGRIFERYSMAQKVGRKAIGRVWTFRDVTDRVRAEKLLLESEERFRRLADAAFEGITVHERGKILVVNESLAAMFGYKVEELQGMGLLDLAAPESREKMEKKLRLAGEETYEILGVRKNGSKFWIEIHGKNTTYQGRTVRVATIRDITDKKRVEEQREQLLQHERRARREAERSARIRDEFINIVAHELKTPLTPLRIYITLFRRLMHEIELPPSKKTELALQALQKTELGFNRISRLVEDLLDMSRITVGELVLQKNPVNLSELLQQSLEQFKPECERAKSPLILDVEPGVKGEFDPRRISQVFSTLFSNAIKYGAGRPISVHLSSDGENARFVVMDHGIGISEEDQKKIFGRFERVAPIFHYGGLGLGLYTARQIVSAHEGTISVESKLGQGSRFSVTLPLRSTKSAAPSQAA